jgi:2-C-methyl-D-erythritol 4-phosphate cytidylyltransferase
LIQLSQIEECLSLAKRHGAAVCAHPLTETIKRADEHGAICETIDRNQVWIMETPQVFRRDLIIKAYEKVMESGELVTDEVSAMQLIQQPVYLCENREVNSKITFPSDLHYAERFLS